jgi:hypothetical protein
MDGLGTGVMMSISETVMLAVVAGAMTRRQLHHSHQHLAVWATTYGSARVLGRSQRRDGRCS